MFTFADDNVIGNCGKVPPGSGGMRPPDYRYAPGGCHLTAQPAGGNRVQAVTGDVGEGSFSGMENKAMLTAGGVQHGK